jgi:hypothetical protein
LDADAGRVQTLMICSTAALLSCLFTGSVFGVNNNLFHLPIVYGLYDEEQFRNDAFIQSLRFYSSGVWLLLSGVAKETVGAEFLFHVLLYLSRLLSFVGFVCCASLLGIRSTKSRIVFCLILCFTPLLKGVSFAGHGAMFANSFGHTEVANGTILLSIYFAARARIELSIIFIGVTFFINAFAAVWVTAPVACICASLYVRRTIALPRLLGGLLVGAAGGFVFVVPVISNILANPDFGRPLSFDYPEFLRSYYGAHFFIDANSVHEVALLLALAMLAGVALQRLGSGGAELKAALVGAISLYAIGILVPFLTGDPRVLNLHLLRSGVMIHLLAALSAAALAARWLWSEEPREATALGPYLLFCLWIKYLFPLAVILIAFADVLRARVDRQGDNKLRMVLFAALTLVVLPWHAWRQSEGNAELVAAASEWKTVGGWARSSTSPGSVFLVPFVGGAGPVDAAADKRKDLLVVTSPLFESTSHRRSWVDYKRGAAVMWQPSYRDQWWARFHAILALPTLADAIALARSNRIDYVIDDCQAFASFKGEPAFRTDRLCVAVIDRPAE